MTVGADALSSNTAILSEAEKTAANQLLANTTVTADGNLTTNTGKTIEVIQPGETVDSGSQGSDEGPSGFFFQGGGSHTLNTANRTTSTTVIFGEGADSISSGSGGDTVVGGGGSDTVDGGAGGDSILGGAGNDVVSGGQSPIDAGATTQPLTGDASNVPSWFDSAYYLRTNPDVKAAVESGVLTSAYQHFLAAGEVEGRGPNANFSESYYLSQNPDVKAAVEAGTFSSGFEHFLMFGAAEGRKPIENIQAEQYLDAYSDVETAVNAGQITAYGHAVLFGATEKRGLSAEDHLDGGEGDDQIRGYEGDDVLLGGSGNDTLFGGKDDDTMTGGDGNDVFVIEANSGLDRIEDFTVGSDELKIQGLSVTKAALTSGVTEVDGNAVITLSDGNTVTLVGVSASAVTEAMFNIVE